MRIHIPALVHRDVTNQWEPCAYTGKILRLCKMLTSQGHEVFLYSGPQCDAEVMEHIIVVTEEDRKEWFEGETWEQAVFNQFDPGSLPWATMNNRTIEEIKNRIEPYDIIGLTMGHSQIAVQAAFPNHVTAEVGIGYEGILEGTHKCYESSAWMHYLWGKTGVTDGRYFDTVIYNAFDPDDYIYSEKKEDYLLYLGRHIPRKGVEVVAEIAKRGHRVVSAGQGDLIPGVEHLGVVRGKEKAELLAGAKALIVPTQYIGPFEGVAVEAMLSGTPAITSSYGAFLETVSHGVSGYHCHTLSEYLKAVDNAPQLKSDNIRIWANRFTLDSVAPQYDRWMKQLGTLYREGWYE